MIDTFWSVHAQLGSPSEMTLVYWAQEGARVGRYSIRSWLPDGVFDWGSEAFETVRVLASVREYGGLVASVSEQGEHVNLEQLYALYTELGSDVRHFESRDGKLYSYGRELPLGHAPETDSLSIVFCGESEHRFDGASLPVQVVLNVVGGQDRRLFSLRAECSAPVVGLPCEQWFCIAEPPTGPVSIGIRLGVSGLGEWVLDCDGGGVECVDPPDQAQGELRHLTLIFDRTCPDEEYLRQAMELVFSPVRGTSGENDMFGSKEEEEGGPVASQNLNQGLRVWVAAALRAALPSNVTVSVRWVADVAGNDLSDPTGLAPSKPYGLLGNVRPGLLAERLAMATYSPGLDLFDPVEQCLQEAVDEIEEGNIPGRAAVLIVGNSPPTLPRDEDTPFRRLLHATGPMTGYRRASNLWDEQKERCGQLGIPLAYLFLELGVHPAHGESDEDIRRFFDLQTRIIAAFKVDLREGFLSACASREGVAEGIQMACERLIERAGVHSCVRILET